ncbi:MAG: peptidylprolyl isomerase [Phycisphaerae bacterium]
MRPLFALATICALLMGCSGTGASWQAKAGHGQVKAAPGGAATSKPAASRPAQADNAPSPSTSQPAGGPVMAYINGQPVYMSELNDLLVRSYGMALAKQLIASELVRQAADAKGITVSEGDIRAESVEILREMFPQVEEAGQRERLLEQMLAQKNMSADQWRVIMQRNAMLRKMAEGELAVTDEEINDEFAQEYGGKVEVRHIQVASLAAAQDVIKKLQDGADFADLARKMSINSTTAADGGLLPAIGANTRPIPPAIRQAALAMKKPGEISNPVQVETAFHVLKLERLIPPQDVKLSDVREKLITTITNRKAGVARQQILVDLFRKAEDEKQIRYVDPVLSSQMQAAGDRGKGQ